MNSELIIIINWPVRLAELDWMRQTNSDTFDSQYIDQKKTAGYIGFG